MVGEISHILRWSPPAGAVLSTFPPARSVLNGLFPGYTRVAHTGVQCVDKDGVLSHPLCRTLRHKAPVVGSPVILTQQILDTGMNRGL